MVYVNYGRTLPSHKLGLHKAPMRSALYVRLGQPLDGEDYRGKETT